MSEETINICVTQPSATLTPQNLTNLYIYRLTRVNYPLWSTIIVPYLEGHNFFGYVTGKLPCPPSRIASASRTSTAALVMSLENYHVLKVVLPPQAAS